MSIDKALQQLVKNGFKIRKIWENGSPSSAFAPQKIGLNLNGETGIFAVCATSNTGLSTIKGGFCDVGKNTYIITQIFNFRERKVTVDSTGVTFGEGEQYTANGTFNRDNAVVIPLTIYAVRFIGGGITSKFKHFLSRFGRRCSAC